MHCVIKHRLFVVTRSNLMSCISQYCTPSSHVLHSAEVFLSGVMLAWLSAWGADLHVAQLMPLPLTVSCFSKIQIGFYLSVTGSPVLSRQDKEPLIVCVCVCMYRSISRALTPAHPPLLPPPSLPWVQRTQFLRSLVSLKSSSRWCSSFPFSRAWTLPGLPGTARLV